MQEEQGGLKKKRKKKKNAAMEICFGKEIKPLNTARENGQHPVRTRGVEGWAESTREVTGVVS